MAYLKMIDGKKMRVGKIVALAKNYEAHAAEMAGMKKRPGAPEARAAGMKSVAPPKPVFFLKPPTSIIHEGESIVFPEISKEIHHEVELAVVIGKKSKNVEPENAMKCVFGYAVSLDMTARDLQNEAKQNGWPWAAAKGFDTFCPIGAVVPREKVPDPENLKISLKVNGELRQRGNTSMMVHKIAPVISHVSKIMTLERGDIILTGTPEGIGPVAHGDRLEAEIEGLPGLVVFVK